ncbi:MAG: plasmid mobilization relaxosome protein MobC [Henriciella sp.]|nr:plasmid mobilization relaxosome protein MobC [Henriciella sp.]
MLEDRKTECTEAFGTVSKPLPKPSKKHPSPVTLRLTREERAQLERDAGDRTLSSYIRFRLFGEDVKPWPHRRPGKALHKPHLDHVILAQLLGALGKSRLSNNLNQIAKAANIGALPVTDELSDELHAACADIRDMRRLLIKALNRAG